MLDEVTAALAAIEAEGAFATELGAGSDDLHVEVEGVGPLRFPISAAAARKLCAVARPAPFGRRDETLYDPNVRDTWEIGAKQITIEARTWRRALDPALATVRQRLGLPEGGKLDAVLDKMLVYGPGQFFAPHQDSERADDMVASLVVELPSKHQGGEVAVQHQGKKKLFHGAARGPKDLSLLAFYADCPHEVQPVRTGYRITLTYHLRFRGAAGDRPPPRLAPIDGLAASVETYFATPVAHRYARTAPERPDRLIYLLDHEYTQRSLGWGTLKNVDRLRAAALAEVADRLDCEAYLALADVHESWQCDEGSSGGGYGRRYSYDDYDEEGDEGEDDEEGDGGGDDDEYELVDLIDTDVELRHWVGRDGQPAPGVQAGASMAEVCFTRPSVEMSPFKREHEGYMGNYGNTVDRWYHRAAVVLWPRERNFVIRAKIDPSWAVREIAALVKKGKAGEARARAEDLVPFWAWTAPKDAHEPFVVKLFTVAASLGAELAHALLAPLGPHRLTLRTTPAFVALVEQYGLAWSQRVFTAWTEREIYGAPRWLAFLPRLCEALMADGKDGEELGRWLVAREVASYEKAHAQRPPLPERVQEGSDEKDVGDLSALLEAAAVVRTPSLRDDLVAFLVAPETALPMLTAGALFQRIRDARTPEAARALGLDALYEHVVGSLERTLAAPPRRPDDWSITPPPGCGCALCKHLAAFLRAPDQIELGWPLAKEKRRHVHGVIDRHGLPLTHTTIRRGSPQTLVLRKQPALFERDKALRARRKTLLAWLKKQRSAFSGAR